MTKSNRIYIGFFGRRNQGKSALINALAGQDIAIVSDVPGTTTDPVKKSIEIFGIGPTVLVDTAGMDDSATEIGRQRVQRSIEALKTIDVALLVISHNNLENTDIELVEKFRETETPFIVVHNKSDEEALSETMRQTLAQYGAPVIECSAQNRMGMEQLLDAIVKVTPDSAKEAVSLMADIVKAGDLVVLVMPQDSEAPEGRLILPQVQVIRDLLDHHAVAIALQPEELADFLAKQPPALVVADSQVFATVAKVVPDTIPLTSFSIVLARSKGHFELFMHDTKQIENLKDGDKILMMESCSHTASCDDIGRHKIPNLLQKVTQKKLHFNFVAALEPLPQDLDTYAFAIQCGGCMVTRKQLWNRVEQVHAANVPISNYGMTLAFLTGIFGRVTKIFDKEEFSK